MLKCVKHFLLLVSKETIVNWLFDVGLLWLTSYHEDIDAILGIILAKTYILFTKSIFNLVLAYFT